MPIKKKYVKNDLLRLAREGRGWTQLQLAEALRVAEKTVRSWESGERNPGLESRRRLCELFGMTTAELGFEKNEQEQLPQEEEQTAGTPVEQDPNHRSMLKRVQTRGVSGVLDHSLLLDHRHRQDAVRIVASSPPLSSLQPTDRNRLRMLRRVEMRWITDVLERSLYKMQLLLLSLQEQPEAIENPWRKRMQETPPRSVSPFPGGSQISEIYDKADGELLILGEPGAGKTTLLLELTRVLLERARHDEHHPLPVVFNLSEWVERHQPLQDWLAQELHIKYQIPSKLAQAWIKAEHTLLLLDGLDEVAPSNRGACIRAINAFREVYGLVPVVVCCRSTDYFSQPVRLLLNLAIEVQPLTTQQIDRYIEKAGSDLTALRQALQQDASLREMASTPLMLNTLMIAYQGLPQDEILAERSPQIQRNVVFARYVTRALERRFPKKTYATTLLKQYLRWLARQMLMRNQTEFYVERLQPDWLPDQRSREQYRRTIFRMIAIIQCIMGGCLGAWLKGGLKNGVVGSGNGILGLFGGGIGNDMLGWMAPGIGGGNQGGASLIIMLAIVIWLVAILVGNPSLPTITPQAIRHGLWRGACAGLKVGVFTSGLSIPFFSLLGGWQHGLSYGLGIGVFLGILVGLLDGLLTGICNEQQISQKKPSFSEQFMNGLFFGGSGGLGFMVVELLLQVNLASTVIYSGIAGLFYWLAYGRGGGSRLFPLGQTIIPAEIVTWSWKQMAQDMVSNSKKSLLIALTTLVSVSAVIGGVSGLFFFNIGYGLRYGLVFGCISGLIAGIASIFTNMLKSGWNSDILPEDQHTRPNEGISRSGRNALIGACVLAPLGGIGSGLACGIGFGIVGGLATWPVMGMAFALMLAIVFFMLLVIGHGAIAWIEHYILRGYLWRARCIPLNYVHFLEIASEYGLMRKVGGGYMFTHRSVLEYFAQLDQSEHNDFIDKV